MKPKTATQALSEWVGAIRDASKSSASECYLRGFADGIANAPPISLELCKTFDVFECSCRTCVTIRIMRQDLEGVAIKKKGKR